MHCTYSKQGLQLECNANRKKYAHNTDYMEGGIARESTIKANIFLSDLSQSYKATTCQQCRLVSPPTLHVNLGGGLTPRKRQ